MSVYVLALLIGVVAGLRALTAPVSWAAYLGRMHLEGSKNCRAEALGQCDSASPTRARRRLFVRERLSKDPSLAKLSCNSKHSQAYGNPSMFLNRDLHHYLLKPQHLSRDPAPSSVTDSL
jgi:hypothetical protein